MRYLLCLLLATASLLQAKPNLLVITVDDMSCDSMGVYGCKLPDTTPNMDRLAAQCLRFNDAHVVVGNCMPSRNVMWSGRYPHNSGVEGFASLPKDKVTYPVLGTLVKDAGWFTGIRHKVQHSTPYFPFPWDLVIGDSDGGEGDDNTPGKNAKKGRDDVKNPASWGQAATQGITAARKAGKPFCLLLNVADPHKPFYAEGKKGQVVEDKNVPTKVFTPDEIPVPGFLPDDPVIRQELSLYYSSVRRADDSVGQILAALKASGEEENTIIVFLSDHGMPLPFAKTQLYHHSSRTPLMIRWPGVTKAGSLDDQHMISTVDLLPTILDMLGLPTPGGLDGKSFAPVLKGEKQPWRTMVFKEHNENAGGQNTPMRAVQTKDWLYVFSPWSNGKRVMSGATAGTETCRRMRVLAKTSEAVAARVDLFDHRVPQEAYEVRYDPDALTNLIAKPENAAQVAMLEQAMEDWMVRTKDPLLEVFRHRDDAAYREAAIQQLEASQKSRKERKTENATMKREAKAPAAAADVVLIKLLPPDVLTAGGKVIVKVRHQFPADLGEKPVQVTLKDGKNERLERKEVKAKGTGEFEVSFDLPAKLSGQKIIFAGLVGTSINDALQHVQTKPLQVK